MSDEEWVEVDMFGPGLREARELAEVVVYLIVFDLLSEESACFWHIPPLKASKKHPSW